MSDILIIGYPGSPVNPAPEPVPEPSAADVKARRPPRNVLQCRVELLDGTYYVVQLHVRPLYVFYSDLHLN